MDFYLYLPSNTGDYIDNSLSRFRIKLPNKVDLEGEWEVALVEIGYPITWFNVGTDEEALISIMFSDTDEYRSKSIPFSNYNSIDGLCDAINYTLDHIYSSNGERVNFNFSYDSINHRVGLKPMSSEQDANVHLIKLSSHLQYMLGFKKQILSPLEGRIEVLFKMSKETKYGTVLLGDVKWSTKSDVDDAHMFDNFNSVIDGLKDSEGLAANCNLVYVPDKAEIVLVSESEKCNILYLKFCENLQHRLGITNDTLFPNTKYKVKQHGFMRTPSMLATADDVPDLKAGQYSLFVYCDVVSPQIIGNILAPILRVVSIMSNYGDVVDQLYDNPHYVPVLKREFDSIEINISDDRGRLVNFKYGKLFAKLHFRVIR